MRNLPVIREKWASGGPFIGDLKAVTRLTVQEPWPEQVGTKVPDKFLVKTSTTGIGSSKKRGLPFRWYQKQDNSQIEREIPNVETVSIDRSVDQDAASFSFGLGNNWLFTHGGAPRQTVLGRPGYFTPTHGDSMEGRARWEHEQNVWNNRLVPNAVIRVYTGFGGESGPIEDAVAAGDLALFGVFLIDEMTISTDGTISFNGRDMMKLLIEQQLFPPLVPASKYPLVYERWRHKNVPIAMAPKTVPTGATAAPPILGSKKTIYEDSAADRWYGRDANLYGRRGSHSVDGNPHSYALSVGNSGPDRPFSTVWWQYTCGELMNAVHVHPWAGGYTMYVSVMEGGVWQGTETVPYDPSHLFATQSPAVDTGANIKYVAAYTVPHEQAQDYVLPRAFSADRVRISFRNLAYSGLGVWKYRGGIREVRIKAIASHASSIGGGTVSGGKTKVDPICMAAAARFDPNKIYSQGYVTASNLEQFDAFGDARLLAKNNSPHEFDFTLDGPNLDGISGIRFNRAGDGYYVLRAGGTVTSHGDAVYYGDPYTDDGFTADLEPDGFAWDMAVTHTGNGYWVLATGGRIYAYGDAVDYGQRIAVEFPDNQLVSIEAHPSGYGYWVVRNDGRVFAYGSASNKGRVPTTGRNAMRHMVRDVSGVAALANASERAACIRCTSTGGGYWIMTTKGRVLNFGDAVAHGQPAVLEDHSKNIFTESYWELLPAPDDKGYLLIHASGKVSIHGEVDYFGGPVPGTHAELRYDGNYLDYTDIIRDLVLWSGFLFYDPSWPSNQKAPVYGGLESTGAFAKERLPDEMFDKKPVVDAITAIREVVGYYAWVDSQGRFRFESPNTWHVGNFDDDGRHVPFLLDIDEKTNMTNYAVSHSDDALRSSIIISSHDPYADLSGTVTTNYTPPSAVNLRGLVKPAMWVNDYFIDPNDQNIMAELIGLQITFQERIGNLTCLATPELEIGDQIRIYERQTEEVYVHYVRGIAWSHNLSDGTYTMTLTTHWLATGRENSRIIGGPDFPASAALMERVESQQYGKLIKDPGMVL